VAKIDDGFGTVELRIAIGVVPSLKSIPHTESIADDDSIGEIATFD
jgi:hypothetical protein